MIYPVREIQKYDIGGVTCYLYSMDNPAWTGRESLPALMELYVNGYNWKKFIKPGSTIVDIGGHNGDTAVPMQYLARGTVLSIEANPGIREFLDMTCRANAHLGKFVTAGEAVTTENVSEVEILDHNNALCNGGLIDPTWTNGLQNQMRGMAGASFKVPGLTLENLCQKYLTEEEIANISFVKTDTEGHDKSILESSANFLDTMRPVIFTEWFYYYTIDESRDLFRVIKDLGYVAYYPLTLELANVDQRSEDLVLIHKSKINSF